MAALGVYLFLLIISVTDVLSYNVSMDPVSRQLDDFARQHAKPIGLFTRSSGSPIDIHSTITINSDLTTSYYYIDALTQFDSENIPARIVHARGSGAYGYFEVTHDVSKYTNAAVFNGIGKKTPVVTRFSPANERRGGTELARDQKGLAVKFYTEHGNLDILCLNVPIFFFNDPIDFISLTHVFQPSPVTDLPDMTAIWDFILLRPSTLHTFIYLQSDYGIPNGYRRMDAFALHTYELNNEYGESYYVRFNFRTEQGVANLTSEQALEIQGRDLGYYTRDLYNAIAQGDYPSWRLEMDVLSKDDIETVDYNPFDLTVTWKKGTYRTVQIGRLVLDRNPENQFRDVEQAAYNPANLVPGIPGPVENLFKGRVFSYRDTIIHRLGINHNKIEVNLPRYVKNYNRNGVPPVRENMGSAPDYYPNSYNGPTPFVDESKPREKLEVYVSNAVDLQGVADFYNQVLIGDGPKQRLANNLAASLQDVSKELVKRAVRMLTQIDHDLGRRVTHQIATTRGLFLGKRDNNEL